VTESELDIVRAVHATAERRILFLPHALDRMNATDPMISTDEVRRVTSQGDLAEDYPDDLRGHSCLLVGRGDGGRVLHVVCAPKDDYLAIITVYLPRPDRWLPDWRTRRKESQE
jgi:hypothetical protein